MCFLKSVCRVRRVECVRHRTLCTLQKNIGSTFLRSVHVPYLLDSQGIACVYANAVLIEFPSLSHHTEVKNGFLS